MIVLINIRTSTWYIIVLTADIYLVEGRTLYVLCPSESIRERLKNPVSCILMISLNGSCLGWLYRT